MKIIIIGGGIGGLATYHALRKHLSEISPSVTIKVYESHSSPASTASIIGGGLGLAPNGLRAISSLSPAAVEYIQARGFTGAPMTIRNSSGQLLGRLQSGQKERYGFGLVLLPRAVVHDALMQKVPEGAVEWGKKVRSVRETEEGVEVNFEDGTTEHSDLVIGADGVRSVVREAIFGKKYEAEYDGLTGVGGFIPLSSLSKELRDSLDKDPITMTFGRKGFFGYSLADNQDPKTLLMWWSTYESAVPPQRDTAVPELKAQLLARHESWDSPHDSPDGAVFKSIISLGCRDSAPDGDPAHAQNYTSALDYQLLVLPRYFTARLPNWCSASGKIVLLGDAAHAMPPDVGQGVSSATEDAVTIALLLKHFLSERFEVAEVLKRSAEGYEAVRIKKVGKLLDMGKRMGNAKRTLKWWEEWIRNFMMWLFCKFSGSFNDGVFSYDAEVEVAKYINTLTSP